MHVLDALFYIDIDVDVDIGPAPTRLSPGL
jgi:hypothetical protein